MPKLELMLMTPERAPSVVQVELEQCVPAGSFVSFFLKRASNQIRASWNLDLDPLFPLASSGSVNDITYLSALLGTEGLFLIPPGPSVSWSVVPKFLSILTSRVYPECHLHFIPTLTTPVQTTRISYVSYHNSLLNSLLVAIFYSPPILVAQDDCGDAKGNQVPSPPCLTPIPLNLQD